MLHKPTDIRNKSKKPIPTAIGKEPNNTGVGLGSEYFVQVKTPDGAATIHAKFSRKIGTAAIVSARAKMIAARAATASSREKMTSAQEKMIAAQAATTSARAKMIAA